MHVVAIIQARMTSSRFPGKVLTSLAGKPVLWHVVHRLQKCRLVETIVLATSGSPVDDPLQEFARKEGIKVFRGSEENVLERYYLAAKKYQADVVVRVTGDVPLVDPEWVDAMVSALIEKGVEWVKGDSDSIHEGFSPFTFKALQKLVAEAGANPVAREHVTGYFKQHPGFVSTAFLKTIPEHRCKGARISVDTPADLCFLEKIYDRLKVPAGEAKVSDVARLLRSEPELLVINAHIYQKKPEDRTYRVLFYCNADEQTGFGHLMRCLALAGELRDRYGYGITFAMSSGEKGFEIVRLAGYALEEKRRDLPEERWLEDVIHRRKPQGIIFDCRRELPGDYINKWRDNEVLIITIDDPTRKRLYADLAFYPPAPQVKQMSWEGFSGEVFTGWEWVVLGRSFGDYASARADKTRASIESPVVLVTMGGSDPAGLTLKTVKSLELLDINFKPLVILGPGCKDSSALELLVKEARHYYWIRKNERDPAAIFARADIAVVSFGVTAYELASIGVPSIILCLSEDHSISASVFAESGIGINLGLHNVVKKEDLAQAVRTLLKDLQLRERMSTRARELVDGKGAQRVAKIITERMNQKIDG